MRKRIIAAIFAFVLFFCGCGAKPWDWAEEIKAEDIVSVQLWRDSSAPKTLPEEEKESTAFALNTLNKNAFTQNRDNSGATPEFGIIIETEDAKIFINQSIAPKGSLELAFGEEQWWIDNLELELLIEGFIQEYS